MTITDKFTDYEGKDHWFVVAGTLMKLDKSRITGEPPMIIEDGEDDSTLNQLEYYDTVRVSLNVGIAICNPMDDFDEHLGIKKALARARASYGVLYAPFAGMLNETVIRAYLEEKVKHIQNNPQNYIAGYAKAKKKYLENLELNSTYDSFTDNEKEVVDKAITSTNYFKKLLNYIKCKR